jgi:hypothetical protein
LYIFFLSKKINTARLYIEVAPKKAYCLRVNKKEEYAVQAASGDYLEEIFVTSCGIFNNIKKENREEEETRMQKCKRTRDSFVLLTDPHLELVVALPRSGEYIHRLIFALSLL